MSSWPIVRLARRVERHGLVERRAPLYALTELGASLLGVVGALAGWAEALLEAQASAV